MDCITQRDLSAAFNRYNTIAQRLGLIPDRMNLGMTKGNKTNGIAYRIYLTYKPEHWGEDGADSAHHNPPFGDDYLGMTARDAYNTLSDRARVAGDIMYRMHLGEVVGAFHIAGPSSSCMAVRYSTPGMKDEAVRAFNKMAQAQAD